MTARFISFAVFWGLGMIGGILAALSEDDWAERFAIRCGDDPHSGGRALRFGVLCFGVFIVPALHIMLWEFVAFFTT